MKAFRWDAAKNEQLKMTRGLGFESVVVAIASDGLLDVVSHPNPSRYPGQRIFIVAVDGYAYLVPFVEDAEAIFMKTIIPSRKATRDYLEAGA